MKRSHDLPTQEQLIESVAQLREGLVCLTTAQASTLAYLEELVTTALERDRMDAAEALRVWSEKIKLDLQDMQGIFLDLERIEQAEIVSGYAASIYIRELAAAFCQEATNLKARAEVFLAPQRVPFFSLYCTEQVQQAVDSAREVIAHLNDNPTLSI